MAASTKFFLKQTPTDIWSLRERLALACSVKRTGDNNWVSVSRSVKPIGEDDRPADWFSQKNCALQYSDLLEKVETPKRKRGERDVTEAPGDIIARKLTIERIEELKRLVQEEQKRYKKLKAEVEKTAAGHADDQLDELIAELDRENKEAEEKKKKWQETLEAREQAKLLKNKKLLSAGIKVKVETDDSVTDSPATVSQEEDSNLSQPSVSTPLSATSDVKPALDTSLQATHGNDGAKPETAERQDGQPEVQEWIEASDIKTEPGEIDILTTTTTIKEEVIETEEVIMDDNIISTETIVTTETIANDNNDDTGKSLGASVVGPSGDNIPSTAPEEPPKPSPPKEKKIGKLAEAGDKAAVPILSKLLQEMSRGMPQIHNYSRPCPDEKRSPAKLIDKGGGTAEVSDDDTSTIERSDTPCDVTDTQGRGDGDKERDVFVTVVDDKQEVLDSASEGPSKYDDQPLSPSSSIMSNDTDASSILRGKGRPSRGGKNRRASRRLTRNRNPDDDKTKESETSSKADTSDDETGDTPLPESDDAASNTVRTALSFTESVPNSPASIAPGDTEDEKAHKIWKKSIMLVWRAASNHKYANVFSHPVTEEIAPGYHSVVHRPLDLSQVKRNIETGQIRTTAEFQRDLMLMFTNAIMYNNSDHDVFHMATEMYDDVMRHIEIMVQGTDTKSLRTSRRSEVHSDKEDDTKRKRQSTVSIDQDGGKLKKRKN